MSLSRIVPMQPVRDIATSIGFYAKLGFTVEQRNDEWGWAMLRCGACELMLDQSIAPHADFPRAAVLYLYPEDLVAFHRRARVKALGHRGRAARLDRHDARTRVIALERTGHSRRE